VTVTYTNTAIRPAKASAWYGALTTGTQPNSAWCCGDLDDLENVYIGSRNVFAKINNTPSVVWQKSLSDSSAIITGLVVDSSYNVYICYVTLLSGSYYVNVEKFNSSGTSVWAKQLTSAVNPLTTTATTGSEPNIYPRMSLGPSSTLFISVPNKAIFKIDTNGSIVWQYSTGIAQSNSTPAVFYTTNTFLTTVTSDTRGNILVCDPKTLTKITDAGSTASVAWSKHHVHDYFSLSPFVFSSAIADSLNNVYWMLCAGFSSDVDVWGTLRYKINSSGTILNDVSRKYDRTFYSEKLFAIDNTDSFVYVVGMQQSAPFIAAGYGLGGYIGQYGIFKLQTTNILYQVGSTIVSTANNYRSLTSTLADTPIYPGGSVKIKGNNIIIISQSATSSIKYPTNMIFKYNLSDSNNNVFYGSSIYRNGSSDTNASKRLSYIKANSNFTETVPVNSDYNISSGGYSANIGINQTLNITNDDPYIDGDPTYTSIAVSSASLSTTSYILSSITSLASTSSETFLSKVFYYKG